MKRAAFVIAIASLAVSGPVTYGQGRGNPFIDHSDTGDTIHVLPAPASIHSPRDTQPTDAPRGFATYPASYGSGNLINHGGHQIPFAVFFPIYWNDAVASSAGSQGVSTLRTQVQNFVSDFSNRNDYTIITQYSSADTIDSTLAWVGDLVDSQPTQSSISDSKVRSYIAGLFNSGRINPDSHTVYGVYFPSGMKITTQGGTSCSAVLWLSRPFLVQRKRHQIRGVSVHQLPRVLALGQGGRRHADHRDEPRNPRSGHRSGSECLV